MRSQYWKIAKNMQNWVSHGRIVMFLICFSILSIHTYTHVRLEQLHKYVHKIEIKSIKCTIHI